MTISSPRTAFPTGWPDPLGRRLALARASLGIERLAPALWPGLGFAGLYLTLALFGAFDLIPWTLQALLLAATLTAIALSLYFALEDVRWPRSHDGARRLERDNHLAHRPISERDDVIAGGAADPFAQALWRAHRARALAAADLKVAAPRPSLERRDPKNLRYVLLIALLTGLAVAHGHVGERLWRVFDSGAGAAAGIDAWIDPPAYTGLPLMSLNRLHGTVRVPRGTVINLRVHGAMRTPGLLAGSNRAQAFAGDNGEYASNTRLDRDATVKVRVAGHVVGRWDIAAIPDLAPVIAFTAVPSRTERDAVKFSFRASDDYGVANARVILTPHGRSGAALVLDLPLEQAAAKTLTQTSYADVTGHPYAGLLVDARLEARDAIGQTGLSKPVTFRLPARVFTDPLARALIEQRQNLATADRTGRATVAATLDALTYAPQLFYDGKSSIYMAIRATYWGVMTARHAEDIAHVEDLLWQTAVALEGGGLLTAADELRRLQQLLSAALAGGAPQDVIDELLKRYNSAMQRYLQALANNPPPPTAAPAPAPDGKSVSQQDIQNLLNLIQQLSKAGARAQAAQMMAVLQNMLENMRMSPGGRGGSGQNKALNDAIQKFGDMMGKQRALLDKTMRQQNGQADPKDGGPQGLSRQQGELQKQLNDALKGMDPKLSGKLGGAGKAMGEAQRSLGAKDLPNAGNAQQQALQALRQGAEALAQEELKESGQGKNDGADDPLGRSSSGVGSSVKIPGAGDLARARAILEELRKRAGEMGRPQQERDYIDRLLKAF